MLAPVLRHGTAAPDFDRTVTMDVLPIERSRIDAEARLLFALVDAAAAENRPKDPEFASSWRSIRKSAEAEQYESAAADCLKLLCDLERRGELQPPWIVERLKGLRYRIRSDSCRPRHSRIATAP
jgi:hypothetical protein